MNNFPKALWGIILINTVTLSIFLGIITFNHNRSTKTIIAISNATSYACNASTVVEVLTHQAIIQIQENFRLHEYQKLEKSGVLTKHDIKTIKEDLVFYKQAYKKLQQNEACSK